MYQGKDMDSKETFTLHGPTKPFRISKDGTITYLGKEPLEKILRRNFPGCEIIDDRKDTEIDKLSLMRSAQHLNAVTNSN